MAGCIPGCGEITVQEKSKAYRAWVRRTVGPFAIRLQLDIRVLDAKPPEFLTIELSGVDRRLRSALSQMLVVKLQDSEGETVVNIVGSFTLTGVLGSLNTYLISAHVEKGLREFATALQEAVMQCDHSKIEPDHMSPD